MPKRHTGFTLIEVIMYIALASTLLVSALSITFITLDANAHFNDFKHTQETAQFILQSSEQAITTGNAPTISLLPATSTLILSGDTITSQNHLLGAHTNVSFKLNNYTFSLYKFMLAQ
jgi:type II secretory pathway pseudopilin PulG